MLSAKDIREFRGFLQNASDRQVQGIYDKETSAGRDDYAELAVAEAERRGITLDVDDEDDEDDEDDVAHATKKSAAQLDREIAEALNGNSHATVGGTRSFLAPGVIHAGDRVTIVDRFGTQRTGKAVMRGPHGWVLNMGGRHGTPAVATDENIVNVKPSSPKGSTAKKTAHARIAAPKSYRVSARVGGNVTNPVNLGTVSRKAAALKLARDFMKKTPPKSQYDSVQILPLVRGERDWNTESMRWLGVTTNVPRPKWVRGAGVK